MELIVVTETRSWQIVYNAAFVGLKIKTNKQKTFQIPTHRILLSLKLKRAGVCGNIVQPCLWKWFGSSPTTTLGQTYAVPHGSIPLCHILTVSCASNVKTIAVLVDFIRNQLQYSGLLHGCRWMYTCIFIYIYKCRECGRMGEERRCDAGTKRTGSEGSRGEKNKTPIRRYFSKGPNFIWHRDSCDNGFCVNGLSRNIIWFNVYMTNTDSLVTGCYTEAVQCFGGRQSKSRILVGFSS